MPRALGSNRALRITSCSRGLGDRGAGNGHPSASCVSCSGDGSRDIAGGRPKVALEIRRLIREMSLANPLWGAPRILGELLPDGTV